MKIYIDQSGKVEYTSQDTIIAYSNGSQKSICMKAKDKRELQSIFREAGKPDMFVFRTFGTLIYLLIEDDLDHIDSMVIDTEYIGYEHLIKDTLMQLIRRKEKYFDKNSIHFKRVGKNHQCHVIALGTFRGERKPNRITDVQ